MILIRLLGAIAVSNLSCAPVIAAGSQPYGCWVLRDAVERLACFDLAVGPPTSDQRSEDRAGDRGQGHAIPVPGLREATPD